MQNDGLIDPLAPFAIGDVVELRSTGPAMTIGAWEPAIWPYAAGARCVWFVQGAMRDGLFPIAALRPAKRQAGKAHAGKAAVSRGIARPVTPKPLATPTEPDLDGVGGDE